MGARESSLTHGALLPAAFPRFQEIISLRVVGRRGDDPPLTSTQRYTCNMHFFASPSESSDEVEIARMVNAPSGIELCLLHSVSEKEVILQSTVAERRERLRVLAGSFEEETNRLVIGIQMVEVF